MNVPKFRAFMLLMVVMLSFPIQPTHAQDIIGKVIAGYQGWLSEPGDGSPEGQAAKNDANYHSNYETYPDLREFPQSEQFLNPGGWNNLPNGNPANLFSSDRDFTIYRHVGWMKQYGIDCAAVQRFGEVATNPIHRDQKNEVTVRMMHACEKIGVKFYIEYDASGSGRDGWGPDWTTGIENDWTSFALGQNISASKAYAHENRKPVVELWGMGLDSNGISKDPVAWLSLISWFKAQGCYVIGGVPTGWLGQGGFRDPLPGFENVYEACDAISPWVVGRFSGASGADHYAETNLTPELAWCKAHSIAYIPCVYPGTSFHNSNGAKKNIIPREHGLLLWEQFVNLRKLGIDTCFISMFDEYNEATAIAKTAESATYTPADQWFLWLDADGAPVSSDFYLRLTHDAGEMIKGHAPLQTVMPTPYWNDLFATGFEQGDLQPVPSTVPDPSYDHGSHNVTGVKGSSVPNCSVVTNGIAQSGVSSLMIDGTTNGGAKTNCAFLLYNNSSSTGAVTPYTILYYWLYPEQDNGRYISLDIEFTDGSWLSKHNCIDQNGHPLNASTGHGGAIQLKGWSVITSRIGECAGKHIAKIWVVFDRPGAKGAFQGYIDDIRISN